MQFLSVQKYSATAADEDAGEWLGTTADDTDTIVLHRFLDKHADKIGKELLSYVKPNNEDDSVTMGARRAWDQLCNLLVELQEAPEVPRLSLLPSSEHREFIDLMNRCCHRNIEPVRDIFVSADVAEVSLWTQRWISLTFILGCACCLCLACLQNRCRGARHRIVDVPYFKGRCTSTSDLCIF